jgi:hypothetical protein
MLAECDRAKTNPHTAPAVDAPIPKIKVPLWSKSGATGAPSKLTASNCMTTAPQTAPAIPMNSGCQAAEVDGINRMVSQVAIKQLGMATMAVANEYTIKNWKASWTGAVV